MDFITLLIRHNVPVNSWGKGGTKNLADLLREIEKGETTLSVRDGELIRETSVLFITVRCSPPGSPPLRLKEDRQVFRDGRVREREHPYGASLGEKLRAGEKPDAEAVERALEEELGVTSFGILRWDEPRIREQDSPSYPGLRARFTEYHCEVELRRAYRPEGYVEAQLAKTTYFVWVEAPSQG